MEETQEERAAEHKRYYGYTKLGVLGDCEGWTMWATFPASWDTDAVLDTVADMGWWGGSSGPGGPFAGAPHLRRRGSRVLVTWSGGLDI
jgi:hypothetical protein